MSHPDDSNRFTGAVTAAVTVDEPRKLEPWDLACLTKAEWDALDIPTFLRRGHPDCAVSTIIYVSPPPSKPPVPAPLVSGYVGGPTGTGSSFESAQFTTLGATGDFSQFRVDPDEIEQKIRLEADKRWRNWMPTKTDRKRPRKSWYMKQVRKEYY